MNFPESVNILGIPYKIIYCENQLDTDIEKRTLLDGQIDFFNKCIRVHKRDNKESMWNTIWHEILHAIIHTLKIDIGEDTDEENLVALLSLGINNVVFEHFEFKSKENEKQKCKCNS